jgi:hypothetical protein
VNEPNELLNPRGKTRLPPQQISFATKGDIAMLRHEIEAQFAALKLLIAKMILQIVGGIIVVAIFIVVLAIKLIP